MNAKDTPDWSLSATAYDAIAPRYDRVPEENRINRYMRRLSVARLREAFPPDTSLLELGCGSGEEALALAERGSHIVGIDPSEGMVRLARAKAEARGLGNRTRFLPAAARDLNRIAVSLGPPFDGAYASFSLAYEPDLRPVAAALNHLLRPGAPLLISVPSKVCLVEFLLGLALFRPSHPGRRLRPWYDHKVGDSLVPIRAYTPRSLAQAMAPHFRLQRVEALPAMLPPPYANRWFAKFAGLADALERFDDAVRRWPVVRSVGDHMLAEFRRTG